MRHTQKTDQAPALRTGLSVQATRLLSKSLIYLSMAASHPLFSILTTFSLLAFLYLPRPLLRLLLSPVPVSALLLLATLLRLGSLPIPSERLLNDDGLIRPPPSPPSPPPEPVKIENDEEFVRCHQNSSIYDEFLFDWGRRSGPLEVIYEEYEGEEAEDNDDDDDGGRLSPEYAKWKQNAVVGSEELSSLGLIEYTDSETGSCGSPPPAVDSWTSQESMCYRWEDEDEDELIEITLEEDNLIEIDISRGR